MVLCNKSPEEQARGIRYVYLSALLAFVTGNLLDRFSFFSFIPEEVRAFITGVCTGYALVGFLAYLVFFRRSAKLTKEG
jgi:hypothetical protein